MDDGVMGYLKLIYLIVDSCLINKESYDTDIGHRTGLFPVATLLDRQLLLSHTGHGVIELNIWAELSFF